MFNLCGCLKVRHGATSLQLWISRGVSKVRQSDQKYILRERFIAEKVRSSSVHAFSAWNKSAGSRRAGNAQNINTGPH